MKQIVKSWTVTRSPVTWHLRSFFHWHSRSRRPGLPPQMDASSGGPLSCTHTMLGKPQSFTPLRAPLGLLSGIGLNLEVAAQRRSWLHIPNLK